MVGGHRGQTAPESSLSAVPGAGRRHRPQTPDGPARTRQAGLNPTPIAPAPCTHPVRRAPGSGPGPWPSTAAAARAQRSSAFRTGSKSSSSASGHSEPPLLRGSRALSPAGVHLGLELLEGLVEQRTDRASPRMVSPPWAASPGGPHGSSPPKFVVPWKKRLSLTKHKGETPRPSPEKPGAGEGGRPKARERGGGARLRAEKVAPQGLTSTAAVAAGLQRPACSLKSFVLKSEKEKLLLSLRQV